MLVRGDEPDAALFELARAVELDSGNARFVYVFGVALNSLRHSNRAVAVLENASEKSPANYDVAWALATIYRDSGRTDDTRAAAERLLNEFPGDENSRRLLDSL